MLFLLGGYINGTVRFYASLNQIKKNTIGGDIMEENKSEYEATRNSYRKAPKIAQKMLLTKAVEKSSQNRIRWIHLFLLMMKILLKISGRISQFDEAGRV